jgi:hypothetical protein
MLANQMVGGSGIGATFGPEVGAGCTAPDGVCDPGGRLVVGGVGPLSGPKGIGGVGGK